MSLQTAWSGGLLQEEWLCSHAGAAALPSARSTASSSSTPLLMHWRAEAAPAFGMRKGNGRCILEKGFKSYVKFSFDSFCIDALHLFIFMYLFIYFKYKKLTSFRFSAVIYLLVLQKCSPYVTLSPPLRSPFLTVTPLYFFLHPWQCCRYTSGTVKQWKYADPLQTSMKDLYSSCYYPFIYAIITKIRKTHYWFCFCSLQLRNIYYSYHYLSHLKICQNYIPFFME